MKRFTILIAAAAVFILFSTQSQASTGQNDDEKADGLKIVVTSLEVNDKAMSITYEIRNESKDDVWVHVGGYQHFQSTFGMHVRANISEDGRTLTIGLSLRSTEDTWAVSTPIGNLRFVRLCPGESQKESISMEIPVHPSPRSDDIKRQGQATHLAVELSYYQGDLPEYFFRAVEHYEKTLPIDSHSSVLPGFYSWINECLISREDELLFRENLEFNKIAVFQVLRTIVDKVRIPYEEVYIRHFEYELPNLTSCTRVEIKYEPSMLDYFFPFASQKNLLSMEELKYLQSETKLVLENAKEIKLLANDINKADTLDAHYGARIERYRSSVDVVCHYGDKLPLSCVIYNDDLIRVGGDVLNCWEGFPSLKKFTPRIEDIDLRMRCAANLKNQWYKFRFYHFHEAKRLKVTSIRDHMIYPVPAQWCDDIRHTYSIAAGDDWWKKLHVCPSTWGYKNNYAMNPNCEPNSPGDMVLLFETDGGWNQYGGSELFTFDNHDPKGGCVLLNDGTVKFIRTEQELHALKWK